MEYLQMMAIDPKFKILSLYPWDLYRLDEDTYIWLLAEDAEAETDGDNYIVLEQISSTQGAIRMLLEAMAT